MNRTSRSVAAAALAAAVALGAATPAIAAPGDAGNKPDKATVKVHKQEQRQAAADRRAARVEKRLQRVAVRKARFLDRLATRHKVARLGETGDLLAASMTEDAETLRGLGIDDAALIRSARPVRYNRVINQARLVMANDLGQELLDGVLEFDSWADKSDLKSMHLSIVTLLEDDADETVEEPTGDTGDTTTGDTTTGDTTTGDTTTGDTTTGDTTTGGTTTGGTTTA